MAKNNRWFDGAYNQATGDYNLDEFMSKTSKKNFDKQGYAVAWDGKDFETFWDQATAKRHDEGESGRQFTRGPYQWENPHYNSIVTELQQAGIDKYEANHLAHAAGITNVGENDVAAIIAAKDQSNTSETELAEALKGFKPETPKSSKPPKEEAPKDKPDKELEQLQENYDENFADGNIPWQASSAVDSYNKSFDQVREAGRDWTVSDYLRTRADDKKGRVADYIGFLQDSNKLQAKESSNALLNAVNEMALMGAKAPDYGNPRNDFDYYAEKIRDAA